MTALSATYDLEAFLADSPTEPMQALLDARGAWADAVMAESRARSAYVVAIEDAVAGGASLGDVGKVLGISRQAVSKLLKQEAGRRERSEVLEREFRKGAGGKRSGWRNGTPQCQACRRIMSAYNAKCPSCHGWSQSP